MRIIIICLFCLGILQGCIDSTPVELEDMVDGELVVYFERFAEEASKRGQLIDWQEQNITASLVNIEEDAVGQCLTYIGGNKQINIEQQYWKEGSDLNREFLVFHELGHCILGRAHLDQSKSNGACISMMNSGDSLCRKNYNIMTRQKYLDELFSS